MALPLRSPIRNPPENRPTDGSPAWQDTGSHLQQLRRRLLSVARHAFHSRHASPIDIQRSKTRNTAAFDITYRPSAWQKPGAVAQRPRLRAPPLVIPGFHTEMAALVASQHSQMRNLSGNRYTEGIGMSWHGIVVSRHRASRRSAEPDGSEPPSSPLQLPRSRVAPTLQPAVTPVDSDTADHASTTRRRLRQCLCRSRLTTATHLLFISSFPFRTLAPPCAAPRNQSPRFGGPASLLASSPPHACCLQLFRRRCACTSRPWRFVAI